MPWGPQPLPPGLEPLAELALDMHWSWNHTDDALWRTVDEETWERTQNPWVILQDVGIERLEALARDPAFRTELERVVEERRAYSRSPGPLTTAPGVAYFCMEFGLAEALPLYAGGLGVLAGDFLKAASDLGAPVLGVGLLYQEGYHRQSIDIDGWQHEAYPHNDPAYLPLQPVRAAGGAWLHVPLGLPGRVLLLRLWQAHVGRARLLLLDSNDLRNSPSDRGITAKLYGGNTETRFLQELVLGVGGWRALEALGEPPPICHINEGHAAFAPLERARSCMRRGLSFREALWATRAGNVFTTHTPVAAGFDAFPRPLVERYIGPALPELPLDEVLALGDRAPGSGAPFSMAHLALRCCARANGVSRRHAEVSRELLAELYPRWPLTEVPIAAITNGVHLPTWDSKWSDALWTRTCGKDRWRQPGSLDAIDLACIEDEDLWTLRTRERDDLIAFARRRLARQLRERGAEPAAIAAAQHALEPATLTLGLARRFASYKRLDLLLRDVPRLTRLLTDRERPVQLVLAGKAHPADAAGKAMLQEWIGVMNRPELRGHALLLEDYDLGLAQTLVQGVDVWINTPRPPLEACGTSGMKVLVNGGLNLSVLDGWWAELHREGVGWAIASRGDDAEDARALFELLEREVVPTFYERDIDGFPRRWLERVRASMTELTPACGSDRMLREYLRQAYAPAAAGVVGRLADHARLARELTAWERRVAHAWDGVRLGPLRMRREGPCWEAEVELWLGGLSAGEVRVELYADATPTDPGLRQPMQIGPAAGGACCCRLEVVSERPAADFTPRVFAWHPAIRIPAEASWIRWGE